MRIPMELLKCEPFPVPSPEEQAAMVRFLDYANGRLERAIRAKRKVIALLHEQKQAIIHRAVTRGLDPTVPLKPSGIPWLGDIPKHWEVLPLKGVCAIQSGITLGKDYAGQSLREYPYLRVANVQAGHANLAVVKTIRVTKAEAERCILQKGDVLMTEGGDPDKLGRGCVWDAQVAPCLHQNHVFAVRPNQSRLEPHFLSALMGTSYARAYFQSTARQTTNLAATNKTKIGLFKVLLPKVDEQTRILTALNDETRPVTTAITRLEREIELLREYRTRLVADVVTGKLDVRPAARQLPEETQPEAAVPADELAEEVEAGSTGSEEES
jgi:type I restriction enzyme S subunit